MKRGIKILKNTVFGFAVAILAGVCICMILQIKPAIVMSGSMEPAIETGSLIFINERDKNISVGDIIAFETGGVPVAHRVVEITDNGFVTKGDNNKSKDISPVPEKMIIGTVVWDVPKIGYLFKWTKALPGLDRVAAYFSSMDSAENTMTVGHNTIGILEDFIPPDKLEPGTVIRKKVNVQNTGTVPCAVRISAEFSDVDMKELAELDIDESHWELRNDGYYYCKEILDVADISHTLFNRVKISDDAKASQLKDFEIMIYAESRNAEIGEDYLNVIWD